MVKIYGKGDTVNIDSSEYWDERTPYSGLTQFLEYQDNTLAIKNIFNDNLEILGLLESINVDKFFAGGILKSSFYNEFDVTQDDYVRIEIGNVIRYYIRCSPGIASYFGNANITKPATELAVLELNKILDIKTDDDEFIDIKYNYDTDKFKGKIHKIVDGHMEIYEYTNGADYEDETAGGYNTGIELLYQMYITESLTVMFEEAIGDELTKIDLELTKEIDQPSTKYYWALDDTGLIDIYVDGTQPAESFDIYYFSTAADLDDPIHTIMPTEEKVYSLATEVFSGDMVIGGTTQSDSKDSGALIVEGGVGIEKNVNIGGNLTVNGTTTTINSVTVEILDNMILLNDTSGVDPIPAGVSAGIAGIEIDRGTLTNYQFVFDETANNFQIGMVGDLQVVATREDDPTDYGVPYWNETDDRYDTDIELTYNPTINALSTTTFNGSLNGNATTATTATTANALGGFAATEFMRAESDGSYYGIQLPGGSTANYLRTTTNGIIPSISGGSGVLGTSSWPFNSVHCNNIYGYDTLTVDGFLLQDSADRPNLLAISKSGATSWVGMQIQPTSTSKWSIMGDQDDFGIYDDENNEWILRYSENGSTDIRHNGSVKLATSSTGVTVTGTVTATTFSGALSGNATSATTVTVNNYTGTTNMRLLGSHQTGGSDNVYSTASIYMECDHGYIRATRVYGAVGNDYADAIEIDNEIEIEYGFCYIRDKNGFTRKSNKKAEKGIIGIATDTESFSANSYDNKDENRIPISVAGFVLAHLDKSYPTGTVLTSYKDGKLTKASFFVKMFYPERIVATVYKEIKTEEWNGVKVNKRTLVKVV